MNIETIIRSVPSELVRGWEALALPEDTNLRTLAYERDRHSLQELLTSFLLSLYVIASILIITSIASDIALDRKKVSRETLAGYITGIAGAGIALYFRYRRLGESRRRTSEYGALLAAFENDIRDLDPERDDIDPIRLSPEMIRNRVAAMTSRIKEIERQMDARRHLLKQDPCALQDDSKRLAIYRSNRDRIWSAAISKFGILPHKGKVRASGTAPSRDITG